MLELKRINFLHNTLLDTTILTVIIPIRAMQNRDIIERLEYSVSDSKIQRDKIDFLIVDDGSQQDAKESMLAFAKKLNMSYIYLDTYEKAFSIARARNIGAMYAKSPYIIFMDVDLYPYDGFYDELLAEIKIQKLENYANDFIMVGVIYLTKSASKEFFNIDPSLRKNSTIQALLENDRAKIEKFSTGTSVNLYNRYSYLSHGGNDEDFEEWGYDDLEFNMRMIRKSHKFQLPRQMSKDYKNFRTINEYRGWKSIYRLFGDITFQKGIVLTHIWHEVDEASNYMQGRKRNRELFHKKFDDYEEFNIEPDALPSINAGKTLLFSKTNPFIYNRKIAPFLGIIDYQDENSFDDKSIVNYIEVNNITRVLMFNPYGSEHRLSLYRAIQKLSIPLIIAERGALRDSVFYDYNGFNAESSSYDAKNWDFVLDKSAQQQVRDYIQEETSLEISLEQQKSLIGASKLRSKLNIAADKKILFVPLQRPSDSVIKYFCGPIGTYENFIALVQELIESLDSQWVVVVKKHPLEDEVSNLNGALYSDANVKDLLELCDGVVLINSGVGLLSMLWNKPVFYCGDVFYGDNRINRLVHSAEDIQKLLEENFQPNKEIVYRFVYFLIENFYSFGKFTTREIPWENGGRMTVTSEIDFYHIRNIENARLDYYHNENQERIDMESILFDRYNTEIVGYTKKKRKFKVTKKLAKLFERPYDFFEDSKIPFLRILKIFFKKN